MTPPLLPPVSPPPSVASFSAAQRWGMLLLGASLLLPLLGYGLLPWLGVDAFADFFNLRFLLLAGGAVIGVSTYGIYWRWVVARPAWGVGFILLAWPLVAFFNAGLLEVGLNLHLRPLLLAAFALPAAWLCLRHARTLLIAIPWLKYYLLFFGWLALYALVFNANAVDPRLSGGDEAMSEGSVSMVQLTAYFYCLLAIGVTAVAVLKSADHRRLLDRLNRAVLWVSGLEALITILGFPLDVFSMELDGFKRAMGIFTHPNVFAHHTGVFLVYLVGLFCYYQGERGHRLPGWLIQGSLLLNLIAFLLGLSKTALGVFALSATVLLLLNLSAPAVRKRLLQVLGGLAVLAPLGLFAFQAISGQSLFTLLEARMDQAQSFTWRTLVWQDLLADVNVATLWLGHGFTAANATVFHLTFDNDKNAQPLMMVHNAYIALLYDLGVMGYAMFAAAGSVLFQGVRGWWRAERSGWRAEFGMLIALTLYFLLVCGFDEMSYMFDAPMVFWTLVTLLYCVHLRERALFCGVAAELPPSGARS